MVLVFGSRSRVFLFLIRFMKAQEDVHIIKEILIARVYLYFRLGSICISATDNKIFMIALMDKINHYYRGAGPPQPPRPDPDYDSNSAISLIERVVLTTFH